MSQAMTVNVSITRSQEVINQKCPGRSEWSVDSCENLGGDRLDLDQTRHAGQEIVARTDRVGQLHAGLLVDIVGDHEEVARADADLVASLGGDVEEGGGDVVVVVEPAEEGSGDDIAVGVDGVDLVTWLQLGNRDSIIVGESHEGQR